MKKIWKIEILLLLGLLFVGIPTVAAQNLVAEQTPNNGSPYYIMVNRQMNTVTVYTLDEEGFYTVPSKAMICSTGAEISPTPLGNYTLTAVKRPWCLMLDGSYGQYSVQFCGNYLFHSICYTRAAHDALITEEYNQLGSSVSHGCVRLQTEDARWIYENCPAGTKVTIYDSEEVGALGKPAKAVEMITPETDNGWDPTDPAEGNPWQKKQITEIAIHSPEIHLVAGEAAPISFAVSPVDAEKSSVQWTAEAPELITVEPTGRVVALHEGTTQAVATAGDITARVTVQVSGNLLPFPDVIPGEWYYPAIRYVVKQGVMSGITADSFQPDGVISRAMLAQLFYRLATAQEDESCVLDFPDVNPAEWYYDAVCWAAQQQLLTADVTGQWRPEAAVTRQELAMALYGYEVGYLHHEVGSLANLSWFTDIYQANGEAIEAIRWSLGHHYLSGVTERTFCPQAALTRAQCASILQRYLQVQS